MPVVVQRKSRKRLAVMSLMLAQLGATQGRHPNWGFKRRNWRRDTTYIGMSRQKKYIYQMKYLLNDINLEQEELLLFDCMDFLINKDGLIMVDEEAAIPRLDKVFLRFQKHCEQNPGWQELEIIGKWKRRLKNLFDPLVKGGAIERIKMTNYNSGTPVLHFLKQNGISTIEW